MMGVFLINVTNAALSANVEWEEWQGSYGYKILDKSWNMKIFKPKDNNYTQKVLEKSQKMASHLPVYLLYTIYFHRHICPSGSHPSRGNSSASLVLSQVRIYALTIRLTNKHIFFKLVYRQKCRHM